MFHILSWIVVTCMYTYVKAIKLYIEMVCILLCVNYTLKFFVMYLILSEVFLTLLSLGF